MTDQVKEAFAKAKCMPIPSQSLDDVLARLKNLDIRVRVAIIVCLVILVSTASIVISIYCQPNYPQYNVDGLHFDGFHIPAGNDSSIMTISTNPSIPSNVSITIRADNPKRNKMYYYYTSQNYVIVRILTSGVQLCNGTFPGLAARPPSKRFTIFNTILKGFVLLPEHYEMLRQQQLQRKIPLKVEMRLGVKFYTTKRKRDIATKRQSSATLDVHCDVVVNEFTVSATVLYNKCRTKHN